MQPAKHILPFIVIAQFCCTSLWFAGNAVMNDLVTTFSLDDSALGNLTSAVQFGFITGTLIFALFTIADRFSPSKVFFTCAIIGASFNLGTMLEGNTLMSLLGLRFMTGFFLAGIYPVGMKIAADYFEVGLGKSLGYLVGALVVGTAFPHLLKGYSSVLPWKQVIMITSILASMGGVMMLFGVPDGLFRRPSQQLDFKALFKVFEKPDFRSAAFGYFGHMWELYSFWAFVPVMILTYMQLHPDVVINIPVWSFVIIGLGGLACVIGGYIAPTFGTKKTAGIALLCSGICCLISPFVFQIGTPFIFLGFLVFWGLVVIADSPLFSTLVAQNAPVEIKGTALTIVNSIGFAITIISIQIITMLSTWGNPTYVYVLLSFGPLVGLIALFGKVDRRNYFNK